jgi:hypothetical protein
MVSRQSGRTQKNRRMKEKIYKYSVISFVISNLITLYLFYDYFAEKPMMFHGLGLLLNFIRLIIFSFGFGVILLSFRLFSHIKKKKNYFKTNFFYVFSAIFSFNIFVNYLICIFLELFVLKTELIFIVFGLFVTSIFMIFDICRNNFKGNKNNANVD